MRELLPAGEQAYQPEEFDAPLHFAPEYFDGRTRNRNRKMGGKALAAPDTSSFTEEQLDARRALQESMDLRD